MTNQTQHHTILFVISIALVFLGVLAWAGYEWYAADFGREQPADSPALPVIAPTTNVATNQTPDEDVVDPTEDSDAPSYLRGTVVEVVETDITLEVDVPVGTPVRMLVVHQTADTTLAALKTAVDRLPGAETNLPEENPATALAVGDTVVVYSGSPILESDAEMTATKIEILQ